MKKSTLLLLFIMLLSVFILWNTNLTSTADSADFGYKPILMTRSELENSVSYIESRKLERPGKMYIRGNTLFINELFRGVHVIDNFNPENPKHLGFITIPGCIDIAVDRNMLYADNAVDLVAIDISSLENINVTKRIKNVFPELTPPEYEYIPSAYNTENRPENTIIIEWEKTE